MIFLCIDWGNTLVKAAVMDNPDSFIAQETFEAAAAPERIAALLDTHRPGASILCSVVNHEEQIVTLLKERTHFFKLDSKTPLPIINAYHSPESLGADRLAAVVGVNASNPGKNNLVVVLGTCITYNFIAKNGAFRGGAISPGFQMRLDAMHQFTDGLPQVPQHGDTLLLGYDTETCMRSGAVFGIASEIDGMIAAFNKEYGNDFNAVLTGGDAPFFVRHIKSGIFADPQLILKGLYQILKHNARFLR
jgi:type III pantothenate kinase